jgi:hypothetical protein
MNKTQQQEKRELVACEPRDVAQWIGLENAALLGSEPILLSADLVERMKLYGDRTELLPNDAAAVLRVGYKGLMQYLQAERKVRKNQGGRTVKTTIRRDVVLGCRRGSGGKVYIPAADLAAFIVATASPPIPTTGFVTRVDLVASRRAAAETRARHNL